MKKLALWATTLLAGILGLALVVQTPAGAGQGNGYTTTTKATHPTSTSKVTYPTTTKPPHQTTTTKPPHMTTTTRPPHQTTTTVAQTTTTQPSRKIAFCHRTGSTSNPYVLLDTSPNAIIREGHQDHTGPIFPAVGPDGKWGDIIPPFTFDSGSFFPGLNWPAGAAILANGCQVPGGGTTTTSSTTAPGETTTTQPGETTTTLPGEFNFLTLVARVIGGPATTAALDLFADGPISFNGTTDDASVALFPAGSHRLPAVLHRGCWPRPLHQRRLGLRGSETSTSVGDHGLDGRLCVIPHLHRGHHRSSRRHHHRPWGHHHCPNGHHRYPFGHHGARRDDHPGRGHHPVQPGAHREHPGRGLLVAVVHPALHRLQRAPGPGLGPAADHGGRPDYAGHPPVQAALSRFWVKALCLRRWVLRRPARLGAVG